MLKKKCIQVNLQQHFGGGEVYTAFLSRALISDGWENTLVRHKNADFWDSVDLGSSQQILTSSLNYDEIQKIFFNWEGVILFHAPPDKRIVTKGKVICIAHMPVYQRSAEAYRNCKWILAVSKHVHDSLNHKKIPNIFPEPIYGVADLHRPMQNKSEIIATSRYDWDRRKVRDSLLSYLYPILAKVRRKKIYQKKHGLTIGIVSRITPIKQFDALFRLIAPILKRHPEINIEIFGAGGFASIRDLSRALSMISGRVRWWGQQSNIAAVYKNIDYLLTGFPEREALGLNVIEAIYSGTPVLAIDAPPFQETVHNGVTGFLYNDPRLDGGKSFEELVTKIMACPPLTPSTDAPYMKTFTLHAFQTRIANIFQKIRAA